MKSEKNIWCRAHTHSKSFKRNLKMKIKYLDSIFLRTILVPTYQVSLITAVAILIEIFGETLLCDELIALQKWIFRPIKSKSQSMQKILLLEYDRIQAQKTKG